jgi:AcrR family transcriptional regulator
MAAPSSPSIEKSGVQSAPSLRKSMDQKKLRRPPAVRSQRKPKGAGQERREEILVAAKALFMSEGFAKVTTRAIAEKAGLSQTGIYLYFPTKEDILRAIGEETHDALAAAFDQAAAGPGTPREVFRRLIHSYIDYGLSHPAEYHLTFTVGPDALAPIGKDFSRPIAEQEAGARSFMRFRDHLARLAPVGLLGDIDPTVATQILWFAGHGAVSLLTTRSHFPWADKDALIASLEEVVIDGLAAPKRRGHWQ